MSATKRLITGGLVLLGAAVIWHAGATIGYTPVSGAAGVVDAVPPESRAAARPASVSIARGSDEAREQQKKRQTAQRGLIDEDLRRQYRAGRLGKRPSQPMRLTPELTDTVLEIAEQLDPELAYELRFMCDDDPREFERIMYTSGRRLLSLADLKHNEPDLFEFKLDELKNQARIARKAETLRKAYHDGDEQRVQAVQGELRELLTEHVAFSLGSQALYMKRLQERFEEHIEQLEQEFNETVANYGRLVQEELDAIMDAARTGHDVGVDNGRGPLGTLNN